jgi:AraC-like DNA-binding protein
MTSKQLLRPSDRLYLGLPPSTRPLKRSRLTRRPALRIQHQLDPNRIKAIASCRFAAEARPANDLDLADVRHITQREVAREVKALGQVLKRK